MPFGGRTAATASSGYGRLNGPYSLPRKPAVVNAFSSSDSPCPSSLWPMLMNAGIDGFLGPSTLAIHDPMWGAATVWGGTYPVCQWYWCREWRMLPRSATTCERIRVPRSSTLATFSSPCEILMGSTTVSMLGNVQRIWSAAAPTSYGVYRLGS